MTGLVYQSLRALRTDIVVCGIACYPDCNIDQPGHVPNQVLPRFGKIPMPKMMTNQAFAAMPSSASTSRSISSATTHPSPRAPLSISHQHQSMACDCDPGYGGYDCSQRFCPYGIDPLFVDDENTARMPEWTVYFGDVNLVSVYFVERFESSTVLPSLRVTVRWVFRVGHQDSVRLPRKRRHRVEHSCWFAVSCNSFVFFSYVQRLLKSRSSTLFGQGGPNPCPASLSRTCLVS